MVTKQGFPSFTVSPWLILSENHIYPLEDDRVPYLL